MKFERQRSAGYMTNWAARLFARAMDRRLKAIGMSSGQMPVLFALGDGGALPQKRLAELAAIGSRASREIAKIMLEETR